MLLLLRVALLADELLLYNNRGTSRGNNIWTRKKTFILKTMLMTMTDERTIEVQNQFKSREEQRIAIWHGFLDSLIHLSNNFVDWRASSISYCLLSMRYLYNRQRVVINSHISEVSESDLKLSSLLSHLYNKITADDIFRLILSYVVDPYKPRVLLENKLKSFCRKACLGSRSLYPTDDDEMDVLIGNWDGMSLWRQQEEEEEEEEEEEDDEELDTQNTHNNNSNLHNRIKENDDEDSNDDDEDEPKERKDVGGKYEYLNHCENGFSFAHYFVS